MTEKYRFTSDQEPSDNDLAELMHEVAITAKEKAETAKIKFTAELKQIINDVVCLEKKSQK